jgi:alkylation response protein AidB-like acyl-CoA dehydrogenase
MPDEEHRSYAATVRRLLTDAGHFKAARAWAAGELAPGRELWRSLAGTGLPALAVPEKDGGLGWYPPELTSAFVELGRACAPGPLVETVALTAGLRPGTPWHGRLLAGEGLATVTDPGGGHVGYAVDADAADAVFVLVPDGGGYGVGNEGSDGDGPDGHTADGNIPDGDTADGGGLAAGTPAGEPLRSVDPCRRLVRCVPGEPVPADTRRIRALATLLTAAQLLGAGQTLLEASVAHVRGRRQFGRPVGSFQAVKHHLANAAVELEFARPLLYGAALAVRGDTGADPRDLPAAKAACARAAYRTARTALQVHGAIGYTDEYDLTLLLRKVRALQAAWGSEHACHTAVLAGELLPGPAGASPCW